MTIRTYTLVEAEKYMRSEGCIASTANQVRDVMMREGFAESASEVFSIVSHPNVKSCWYYVDYDDGRRPTADLVMVVIYANDRLYCVNDPTEWAIYDSDEDETVPRLW